MAASDAERIKAIQKALCHQMFYDGDIGADIRWLLARVEVLEGYERANACDITHAAKVGGLEQLLDDYRACEDNDRGDEWYWLDEIEKRIGRERYRRIMFPTKHITETPREEIERVRESAGRVVGELRMEVAELKASCVCHIEDGLVQEWVQKARAVARSKGLLPTPTEVVSCPWCLSRGIPCTHPML